jgi:3-hydroxyacyl-CoA dehydrogenase
MLGVAETLDKMEAEGYQVAGWVREMLGNDCPTFYQYENGVKTGYYDIPSGGYVALEPDPKKLTVTHLKAANGEVERNDAASLVDMGDGVLLFEFHAPANTVSGDTYALGWKALEWLDSDFEALVIGNQGDLFSGGANLDLQTIQQSGNPLETIEKLVKEFQDLLMSMRYSPKPVVVAPFDRTLAGGCEISLAGARVVASSELYMGLVEIGVGLIPAGGGCKELLRRVMNPVMRTQNADPLPPMQRIFEQIGFAKVSMSAGEAREMGFLSPADRIVVNRDHLLSEAKREALHMVASGYRPPVPEKIYAAGRDVLAALEVAVFMLEDGKFASEHDAKIARKLGYVLTGGDLSAPTWVDEQYILDLEREAFVSLIMEPKTMERIMHMLSTGKPLRN